MTRPRRYLDKLLAFGSGRVLGFALATSLVVLVLGSMLIYEVFVAGAGHVESPSGLADDDAVTVVIGRTPGGPTQWLSYLAALRAVEERTGLSVRVRYPSDRSEVADAVLMPDVDGAFVSIYQYLMLEEDGRFELLARPVVKGVAQDTSVIVVRRDSQFRSLEDLRGTDVALGAGRSVGGFAYARWLMAQRGTTLEEFFGNVRTGAQPDANLRKVDEGIADVAVVNRSQLAAWPSDSFRIIDESPDIGMPPFVVRSDMSPADREQILATLVDLRPGRGLSEDSAITGFEPAVSREYAFARVLLDYVDTNVGAIPWTGGR